MGLSRQSSPRIAFREQGGSGHVLQHTFGRASLARAEIGREAVQCRAVRADDLVVVAEVQKHMRMVKRRIGADAHEFLRADLDDRHAGIILEMWNDRIGHR